MKEFKVRSIKVIIREDSSNPIGIAIGPTVYFSENWHSKDAILDILTKKEAQEVVDKLQKLIDSLDKEENKDV